MPFQTDPLGLTDRESPQVSPPSIPPAGSGLRPVREAPGGVIDAVEQGSVAEAAGLRPGDRVLSVNGRPLWDVLDYQFYAADSEIVLLVEREGSVSTHRLDGDEGLGIRFAEATFDGIRRCKNRCPFCFVHQNPRGARKTLYIKDDDYRYSALYGGFVTLTNLDDSDWQRIVEQRLSPLNVSVHATELEVRRMLLGNPKAPDVLPQIRWLIDSGIAVNAQVVLCPGLNDGDHLRRTIEDLAPMHPGVRTLSVVPVGLTDNGIRKVTETRRHRPGEAREVLADMEAYRRRYRRELGVSFVYPSDEFYILAGSPFPSARFYDGFPQFSNGVGMVRSLLEEVAGLKRRKQLPRSTFSRATLVTGTLAAPLLQRVFAEVGDLVGCQVDVVPVANRYFGPSVTVAGLLTGGDILAGLEGRELGEVVLAPRYTLDTLGARFLDDVTPTRLEFEIGRPLRFAASVREFLEATS